jgi:mRNA interferase MazF
MEALLITKGKIVLVPFPFDDLSTSKARPAVCLTSPIGQHQHVVLAIVSSRITTDSNETDVVVDLMNPDFKMTGLKVTSVVKLHRLMTVTTSFIQRELGGLSPRMKDELAAKLKKLFELG